MFYLQNVFLINPFRYIDGHHHKFKEATGVQNIPHIFYYEEPKRIMLDKTGHLNKKLPQLESKELIFHSEKLESLKICNFFQRKTWYTMADHINGLQKSFQSYSTYLWQKQLAFEESCETESDKIDNIDLFIVEPTQKGIFYKVYKEVEDAALNELEHYDPINLCSFAPINRLKKYRWIKNLRLSTRVQVYRLRGRQATYAWRIP